MTGRRSGDLPTQRVRRNCDEADERLQYDEERYRESSDVHYRIITCRRSWLVDGDTVRLISASFGRVRLHHASALVGDGTAF